MLGMVEVRVTEAPTGTELLSNRFSVEHWDVAARLTPDGALVWRAPGDGEPPIAIDASGAHPSREPESPPWLEVGPSSWRYVAQPTLGDTDAPTITLADGRVLEVGRASRAASRYALETSDPDVLVLVTVHTPNCSGPGDAHFTLERLVISTSARTTILDDVGLPVVETFGTAIYLQVGETLRVLFGLGTGPTRTVRPGLGLTSISPSLYGC
jgi:hypothetical protein